MNASFRNVLCLALVLLSNAFATCSVGCASAGTSENSPPHRCERITHDEAALVQKDFSVKTKTHDFEGVHRKEPSEEGSDAEAEFSAEQMEALKALDLNKDGKVEAFEIKIAQASDTQGAFSTAEAEEEAKKPKENDVQKFVDDQEEAFNDFADEVFR
eukprot:gnl/TRDRNA2_/TRDRNA2_184444_c0_seq1.p1 gnl/TRDRNA2_/TRDRNA2_184444_c0~~gnl/TRDRNA2_/TRDRNA2_184444_c0_seq1.p1  ORF type:complete len:158 (-),score=50.86 gnl/TRDRNA2_/TRDRNA2_184444_c0_seq1:63-536(-)